MSVVDDAWQAAIDAANRHIELGKAIQARGLAMLRDLGQAPDHAALNSASAAIERGAKVEREGRSELLRRQLTKPEAFE